tara:strand:+ start:801 stop:1778 length:978 start_codon:yes stop_codon:yes gene_type:complete
MSNFYDTALIGTGYWGSIIFNTLSKITKKNILIYDLNIENSLLLKKRFGSKVIVSESINQILENKNIKNVILATHPSVNFKLSKSILNSDKNLFAEKPILTNIKKLTELVNLAKKNKKIFMGGYIYIYNTYINKIKKIIDSKTLGTIKFIEIQRKNLGPIRNEVDAHVDLGSHDISILKYLFKKKIKIRDIKKNNILKKKISDISSINAQIGNIKCEIISSWLNPTKERKLLIIGSKKMLLFDEMNDSGKLKVFNKYAEYPKIINFKKDYISNKARIYEGKTKNYLVKETDTLKNELLHFQEACKKKIQPITNGNFCLEVLKLII